MNTKKVKALAIDAEFTSFDMIGGDMLSLGTTEVLEDYTLGRENEFYFRPEGHSYYSEDARQVHGISLWKAATFPKASESLANLTKWVEVIDWVDDQVRLIWYGSWDFDRKWIEVTYRKQDMLSDYLRIFPNPINENVLKQARAKLKHVKFKNWKLPTVAKHWGIEVDHHKALSDSRGAALIWCNLEQNIDTWTGELF